MRWDPHSPVHSFPMTQLTRVTAGLSGVLGGLVPADSSLWSGDNK